MTDTQKRDLKLVMGFISVVIIGLAIGFAICVPPLLR